MGQPGPTRSKYITGARRTHVGVVFPDGQVNEVRKQIHNCLEYFAETLPEAPREFHFTEIYNGSGPWEPLRRDGRNILLIEAFCGIYSRYRWPVIVQTIDDRTLRDHKIEKLKEKIDGLDLSDRQDASLLFLCLKIKKKMNDGPRPLTLIIDE